MNRRLLHIIEWLVAVAAIPLYLVVYELMSRLLAKQMEQPFVKSRAILASGVIVGVLLCGVYVAVCCTAPVPSFASVTEAYLAAPQPFADSPSALLAEMGKLVAVVDGAVAYGQSVAGTVSFTGYLVWKIVISASAFFGIASLLGVCVLELRELKLVFLPIEAAKGPDADVQPLKRIVATVCVLPILLVGGFLFAEHQAAKAVQTEEYTAIEQILRDNVGLVAYVLDGKYYDQQQFEALDAAHMPATAVEWVQDFISRHMQVLNMAMSPDGRYAAVFAAGAGARHGESALLIVRLEDMAILPAQGVDMGNIEPWVMGAVRNKHLLSWSEAGLMLSTSGLWQLQPQG